MTRQPKGAGPRAALLLGAATLALAGCEDTSVETLVFPDLASCEAQAAADGLSEADCEAALAEAEAEHEATAPRYDDLALCEEQHGAGACAAEPAPGGGSIFLPLLAGYMMGRALGGGGFASRPLVGSGAGGVATTDGGTRLGGTRGSFRAAPAAFTPAPATATRAAPLTRATVARTGGFGAAPTGARGFGG